MATLRSLLPLVLALCAALPALAGEQRSLKLGKAERGYFVHAPAGLPDKAPLVIMLHGAGGNGRHAADSYLWTQKADQARFLLVAPDAAPVLPDRRANFLTNPRVWNDGSNRAGPNVTASDDIGLLRALIDMAARQYGIDRKRVYVAGFSSGSSMTQRAGVEMVREIAAIAPAAGHLFQGDARLTRGMPMLYLLGDSDPLAPYDGGDVRLPWGNKVTRYAPARLTPERWAAMDGCESKAQSRPYAEVRLTRWTGCRDGAEVAFYLVEGMGHHWPGSERPDFMERRSGPSKNPFRAVDLMWDFFEKFRLP